MNPFKYGCTVEGDCFCPRPKLAKRLKEYIRSGQNVVIQGERRMGKTSLVLETVRGMKGVTLYHADFLFVRDRADLCRRLVTALARLESSEGWFAKIVKAFAYLKPTVSIDPSSGSPTFSVDARLAAEPSTLDAVLDSLLAQTTKRKVCAVLDEFQDILKLADANRILAEMRGTIQFQADTPYFYLGSVRNDMLRIFTHYDSPFFKSALPFEVSPIDTGEFARFIVSRFKKGGCRIDIETARSVIEFADGVSGDVQELCDALWGVTDDGGMVTAGDLPKALAVVFAREKNGVESIIEDLTPNQLTVLKGLAEMDEARVFTADFMNHVRIASPGAIKRALNSLVALRLIYYRHRTEYRFSNPFFREWLKANL